MTFKTEASKQGRRKFVKVELELDFCGESYGVAPCTASEPDKCFNTFPTCDDIANYNRQSKVYEFADCRLPNQNIPALILSTKVTATEIGPKGITLRDNAQVTFRDTLDTDAMTDPYYDERSYIARENGTYWGKFIERNRNYYGRTMRIIYGFLTDDDQMTAVETYTYLIDKLEYDNRTKKCKIIGKDALTFADALRSKYPEATDVKLPVAISDTFTGNITLGSVDEAAIFSPTGRARIGKEVMVIAQVGATDQVSISSRGLLNTTAESHDIGATMQRAVFYNNDTPDVVLTDLLRYGAGIDISLLDTANWATEATNWLGSHLSDTTITKPTEVNKMVQELNESAGINVYADARDGGIIKMKAEVPLLGAELALAPTYDDACIIRDSLKIKDRTDLLISRVLFSHTLINPVEYAKDPDKFLTTDIRADAEAESDNGFGKPFIRNIFSRWISASGGAILIATRLLARFKNVPKEIEFQLDASETPPDVGANFFMNSRDFQDEFGEANLLEFQCRRVHYDHDKERFYVKALQFRFSTGRQAVVAPNGQADYTASSAADQAAYAFIADSTTERMSNGDDPYLVV